MAQKFEIRLDSIKMSTVVFVFIVIWFTISSNGQSVIENTPYEGIMHYTKYDSTVKQKRQEAPEFRSNPSLKKIWGDEDAMFIPELTLQDPKPRNGSLPVPLDNPPCGGTEGSDLFAGNSNTNLTFAYIL